MPIRAYATVLLFICCLFYGRVDGAAVAVNGGTLQITYDGDFFASQSSLNPGVPISLTPGQDLMRFGRFFSASETVGPGPGFVPVGPGGFRPEAITVPGGIPQRNFRDNRAELDPLYPKVSPVANYSVNGIVVAAADGRNQSPTTFVFDTTDILNTATGDIETNGVASFWYANDAVVNTGSVWIGWGDLSLAYDASRNDGSNSGWVFSNGLAGAGPIFDVRNAVLNVNASDFTLTGDLFGSDAGTSVWGTTGLVTGVRLGSFSLTGNFVPVPEPSTVLLGLPLAGMAALILRQRHRMATPASVRQ